LTLASEKVLNRFSLTLLIGTISWACLNVGHAFISSGQMRRWLQMQDPKDQAMLINLLGRLYTILVLLFSENPGQMYNRRILANISLRYEDLGRIAGITSDVRQLLEQHPDIDQRQTILVNFNEWDASSINMMVYCFTKTTMWREWLDIQQSIFLEIAAIVQRTGADFAFNCTTLYPAPDANAAELPTLIRRKDQAA